MRNLTCNDCRWFEGFECVNRNSEWYKIIIPENLMCEKFCNKTTTETINKETVNHPNHYNIGGIEVIDFIESWDLKFSLGNAIKYIARAPYKNNELEDLKKARWYIDREIQRLEKNTNK